MALLHPVLLRTILSANSLSPKFPESLPVFPTTLNPVLLRFLVSCFVHQHQPRDSLLALLSFNSTPSLRAVISFPQGSQLHTHLSSSDPAWLYICPCRRTLVISMRTARNTPNSAGPKLDSCLSLQIVFSTDTWETFLTSFSLLLLLLSNWSQHSVNSILFYLIA